jgi:pimeloyl-ACP methyl ester carboxylesterase
MGTVARVKITTGGVVLQGFLARPAQPGAASGRVLILCHGFPSGPLQGDQARQTYPQLAERLADQAGWQVLTFNFRGTGESEGDFSLGGWMADLRAVIDHATGQPGRAGVWLAGFSVGGALALCAAGEDERVQGVVSLGAPAAFDDWAADPGALVEVSRRLGLFRTAGYPQDLKEWARDLSELRPLALVGKIPPRPLLIVHGSHDDVVPLVDARALADAAESGAQLRILPGAGHRLRHDPRAIAVLLGWMERLESYS